MAHRPNSTAIRRAGRRNRLAAWLCCAVALLGGGDPDLLARSLAGRVAIALGQPVEWPADEEEAGDDESEAVAPAAPLAQDPGFFGRALSWSGSLPALSPAGSPPRGQGPALGLLPPPLPLYGPALPLLC